LPRRFFSDLLVLGAGTAALAADWVRTVAKQGKYEDVRQDVADAIINKGLKIDYTGKIGDMLERTGADVGSTKPIYKNAEFFTFCSARLSRLMMEADPLNIASCPYVMFVYEAAVKPGEIIVGYRAPLVQGGEASRKAVGEIDKMLATIAAEAVR